MAERRVYELRERKISALPFTKELSSSFTVRMVEQPYGRWLVLDRSGYYITVGARRVDRHTAWANNTWYQENCFMGEAQAFAVAKEYLSKVTVNGYSATDALLMDAMSDEEFQELAAQRRSQMPQINAQAKALLVTQEEVESGI